MHKLYLMVCFLGFTQACKTAQPVMESSVADEDSPTSDQPFDIIDTSFLLPFPEQDGFTIKAAGDSVNTGNGVVESVIMSAEQFKRLPAAFHQHANPNETPESLLNRLYITGFRYDPCFPIVTPDLNPNGPGCRLRAVRLVGQFIDFDTGEASKASMHILFVLKHPDPNVDVATNNAMIQALKNLRTAAGLQTAGTPLGVHPGFYGPDRLAFAAHVKALILKFSGQNNFFATSIFFRSPTSGKDDGTTWNWAQFLMKPVSADEPQTRQLVLEPVTGTKPGVSLEFSKVRVDSSGNGHLMPGRAELRDQQDPASPLFFPIPDLSPLLDTAATPQALGAGIAAADVFENPTKMTIPAGDCGGCHLTTQRRLQALGVVGDAANRTFAFQAAPGLTSEMAESVAATMQTPPGADPDSIILFNFGYHGNTPVISQRTVNEAVQATRLINEKMWTVPWGS